MQGEKIYLSPLELIHVEQMVALRLRNFHFFQPFEPMRSDLYYTIEEQRSMITRSKQAAENDQAYGFGIFIKDTNILIGKIELSGIARGPFQNAYLGYFLDQEHNGKGYASEAVSLCVKFALSQIDLHRIQAGVMPKNTASIRVLEKAGFRYEGLATKYLKINGVWEDHALYAVIAEDKLTNIGN